MYPAEDNRELPLPSASPERDARIAAVLAAHGSELPLMPRRNVSREDLFWAVLIVTAVACAAWSACWYGLADSFTMRGAGIWLMGAAVVVGRWPHSRIPPVVTRPPLWQVYGPRAFWIALFLAHLALWLFWQPR